MTKKQVIFVQGEKKDEKPYPWMFFHFDPFKDTDPTPVQLVYFDYPDGKIKTWNSWKMKRDTVGPTAPDKEEEIKPKTKKRESDGTLGPEKPSILALYDYVKKQDKESIISLQVFSHGFIGGPIIWNSYEYDSAGNELDAWDFTLDRDLNDTDFRIRDFFGKNPLAGAEGQKFTRALAPGAFVKLWGCVAPTGVRAAVQNFKFSPKNDREKAANKARLNDYLDGVESCFAFIMARELNTGVWASPYGWGSEPGSVVPTNKGDLNVVYRKKFPPDLTKERWWRVSWFFRNQDRGARFYKEILKARVDKTDFVEFTKAWFDDARREATASLEPGIITTPKDLQQRLLDRVRLA